MFVVIFALPRFFFDRVALVFDDLIDSSLLLLV